jgi:tetratricopeptide (TPR) repeat protein
MKKLSMILALTALTIGASAQTLNVQSAIQDLKKNYLKKAKAEIDAACEHESTKDDAKTWCYKGLIYSRIGGEATNPKSKFKDLAPDWAEQAYAAALECKRLDTKNEYADENNSVLRFVGNEYYSRATEAYNKQNYSEAMQLADKAIEMYTTSGDSKFAGESTYIAGISAKALKDNENLKKYFNNLVRKRTDKQYVYRTLFNTYKEEGNKDQAMKIANSYLKNRKDDYNAYLLMAEGYLLNENLEKGKEMINEALNRTKDSAMLYPQILGLAAQILENMQDYEGAEAKYQESLTLNPTQFDANFGMGKMVYNRAIDKLEAANKVPETDESGLYDKLLAESNEFFSKSIPYFTAAISYIDNLTDANAKAMQRANLFNCLTALNQVYARLERYDDLKAVKARIEEIQKAQ